LFFYSHGFNRLAQIKIHKIKILIFVVKKIRVNLRNPWLYFLNPNYALENVMKVKNTIKISTHGLFWMKKYINILIFKKGVSAYF
jgi:hypothetical protein